MARQIITNVQILRFVAAGSVLLTHSADLLVPRPSAFFRVPWSGGVDLFFVISGFIMTWLTWGRFGVAGVPRRFLLRRAIRIVPPYWFFTSLMVAAALFVSAHVKHTRVDAVEIVTSYGFIPWPRPSDGVVKPILSQGWTLNYEAFFYVAFTLALMRKDGLRWLCGAFVVLAAVHYFVPRQLFVLAFYSDPIILEFLAGIGLAHFYMAGVRLPLWGSLACAALAATWFVFAGPLLHLPHDRFLLIGVAAALLSAAVILAQESPQPGPVRRLLTAGGDASYTLYLSHTFTANAGAIAWHRFGRGSPWWGVALAAIVAVAVALLLYRFVERPVTQALNRRMGLGPSDQAQRVAP